MCLLLSRLSENNALLCLTHPVCHVLDRSACRGQQGDGAGLVPPLPASDRLQPLPTTQLPTPLSTSAPNRLSVIQPPTNLPSCLLACRTGRGAAEWRSLPPWCNRKWPQTGCMCTLKCDLQFQDRSHVRYAEPERKAA